MIERVLITVLIGAVVFSLYHLWLMTQRRRANVTHPAPAAPGHVRLLYFRSQQCGTCAAQALYLEKLDDAHRALVESIDAVQQPDVARQYNIMTLPTTIIINRNGDVRHINPGLTNPFKLTRQLEDLLKH